MGGAAALPCRSIKNGGRVDGQTLLMAVGGPLPMAIGRAQEGPRRGLADRSRTAGPSHGPRGGQEGPDTAQPPATGEGHCS
eukprot:4516488-Pyramimonas_sp.AAC.1